jgi:chaperonin GroES
MKLKPLDDRVVVKQSEAEEKSSGGIILPDTAKEKPQMGKIVAVGPGKLQDDGTRAKMSVKKGDQVIYAKYMGSDVEIDGDTCVILKESDILGIVEK